MSPTPKTTDRDTILTRVLRGIESNREPGYHFPGNFLGISFDELDERHALVSMGTGPHLLDSTGEVAMPALSIFADLTLAAAIRGALQRSMRLATVNMHLQFTGAPRSGTLSARSDFEGYFRRGAAQQGITRMSLRGAQDEVCIGSGTFMVLEPPAGFKLPQLRAHREPPPGTSLLAAGDLKENEAPILARATAALGAVQQSGGSFLDHFWHFQTRKNAVGASASLKNGAHVGNRVGHVQGGILLGLAEAAARAALPPQWLLSSITACYLSPGEGASLTARAKIVHQGGRTAVVQGVITGANRRRVLETVATYSAPAKK
ncbi:MAG: hypothetical protein JWN73_3092 [Betaproteobacteria bacterium]|nr:hypothetical protein [Betaproteobacteria bacterium]